MKTNMFCVVACGLAVAGSGCISVKIGQPTVQTAVYKAETVGRGVASRTAGEAGPAVEQEGTALRVGLRGRVLVTEKKADIYRELVLTRQRKMWFGFSPGFAQDFSRGGKPRPIIGGQLFESRAAFDKVNGTFGYNTGGNFWELPDGKVLVQSFDHMTPAGILGFFLATPVALVITPFAGKWEADNVWWAGDGIETLLYQLAPEDRARLGINTCQPQWFASTFLHSAFVGFHRATDLTLDTRFARDEPFTVTNLTGEVLVRGPYQIEVEIPDIGYKRRQLVMEGETAETFYLPSEGTGAGGAMEVEIRFYAADGEGKKRDANERAILVAAEGNVYRAKVRVGENKE